MEGECCVFNYADPRKEQEQGEVTEPFRITASVTRRLDDPALPDSVGPAVPSCQATETPLGAVGHLSDF